mgnify:CR=1 FL=1
MRIHRQLLAGTVGMALLGALVLGGAAVAAGVDGLRKDNPIPETTKETGAYRVKEDAKRYSRDFPTQPPLVPQAIEKYQISGAKNECLDCHGMENYIEEDATKISQTHFVGREGHHQMSSPDEGRWFCNQCHVPQTDADVLVESEFQPMSE